MIILPVISDATTVMLDGFNARFDDLIHLPGTIEVISDNLRIQPVMTWSSTIHKQA